MGLQAHRCRCLRTSNRESETANRQADRTNLEWYLGEGNVGEDYGSPM